MSQEPRGRSDDEDIDARFAEIVSGLVFADDEASGSQDWTGSAESDSADSARPGTASDDQGLGDHGAGDQGAGDQGAGDQGAGDEGLDDRPAIRELPPGVNPAPVHRPGPPQRPAGPGPDEQHRREEQTRPDEHRSDEQHQQGQQHQSEEAPPSWRDWSDPEAEEHFIPPDPPPLPAGDLHFWAIVIGLTVGPMILLFTHGFTLLRGGWWTPLGLLLSVTGFVLLVLRSSTDRNPDDDPSRGAQV